MSFRLPVQLVAELDLLALQTQRTRNALVQWSIERFVNDCKAWENQTGGKIK